MYKEKERKGKKRECRNKQRPGEKKGRIDHSIWKRRGALEGWEIVKRSRVV